MRKINLISILSISLLFLFVSSYGQKPIDINAPFPIDTAVRIGKLPNGMTYYVKQNAYPKNRAELNLVVNAGSVFENDEQQGLAHFCEHMAFNGTKNFPKNQLVNYLESLGMKFGPEVNAYTSFDETFYGIKVPLDSAKFLEKGLQVLVDWGSLISFEPTEIDKERGVIHEEWRIGRGAQDRMMRKSFPAMFYNSKYAERLPIGKIEIIDNFKHEVITKFYKDWYRPELMAVIVVGDFDVNVVEAKVKEMFSQIPKSAVKVEKQVFEIPDHDKTLVSIATDAEAQYSMIELFYKHPMFKMKTIGDYKKSIAHSLYNNMINKRLAELTLQPDPPFMQGFAAYSSFLGPKDVYMSIAVAGNDKLNKSLETLLIENERVKRFGFTATELEREKKAVMKDMEKAFNERNKRESESFVNEYHQNFAMAESPIPGIEFEYELYKKFVPEITLTEINQLAAQWITDKNRVIVVNAPEKEGVKIPTEEEILKVVENVKTAKIDAYVDKVSNKPLVGEMPTPAKIEKKGKNKELGTTEWSFANGVKVVIKSTDFKDDEIKMTAFSMGGTSNLQQKDDISGQIATDVIMESGISEFDKTTLDKMLSDKVVSVEPYIGELSEGFNGSSSIKDFETMLQLVYLYFTKPRVDESAFSSYIDRMKGSLENKLSSPEALWRDTITAVMSSYHPRRRPMSAQLLNEANLKRIDYIFKQRFGDPGSFTFYFVGNVNEEKVKPLIEKYLGGLPLVTRTETYKDLGIKYPQGIVKKEVVKGTDKTMIYMGFTGAFNYTIKDKIELDAVCKVLSTKLLEVVREDKSGVYTIGAYPSSSHYPTSQFNITVFFSSAPERIEELTEAIFVEIEKLQKDGPSEIDLNKVKEKEQRELETSLRENDYWLKSLKNIGYDKFEAAEFLKYGEYSKALSNESIKQAAKKYFSRNNYTRLVLKPEKVSVK